ncbi:WD40-repeat-containing domain protein [Rhypophila sp. PSN 637]
MYNLSCSDGYKYPGSEPVYITDIIPLVTGLAAAASDQSIRLFDPLRLSQGPIKTLQTNHGNLTSTKAFNPAESIISTTGENGTVSLWDLRLDSAKSQVLRIQGTSEAALLSLACSSQTNTIAAGTELANHQASILIWDLRSPSAPKTQYNEVHSDDVTELNFHPTNPTLLLSGSTDGLVNINDISQTDEDEVVIQAFNHGSIHHAGFLNESTEVYALSHDEKFALYDMAESAEKGTAIFDTGDIRSVVNCQYVANVVPKVNGAGAVLGVGSQDQELFCLIHLTKIGTSWSLDSDTVVGLPGAHGSELVRSFCLFDEQQVVFTSGEDGWIKAWRPTA